MAAALASITFIGRSGRRYVFSGYLNDTTNNLVKFDESKVAASGSPDSVTLKEPGFITDICLTSDVATPSHLQLQRNGIPTGDILDCTAQLASVVNRPVVASPFNGGDKLQIMQVA